MTYKTKNKLLIAGLILIGIIVYQLAISETLSTKKQKDALETKVMNLKQLSQVSSNLLSKEKFLDSILLKNDLTNSTIQNSLLDFLNNETATSNLKITEFLEPHFYNKEGINVVSFQFTLEGTYKETQEILYQLEQNTGFGMISHVALEKKRDFRKRKNLLFTSIIVESYDSH